MLDSLLFGPRNVDPMGDGSSSQLGSDYKGKARARNTDNDVLSLDVLEQGSNAQGPFAQMQLVAQQDDYIQQRSSAIESVEATIAELGQIFQQLAHMVAEQRETVQRIDADTLDIASNVEGAQRELLKYFSSMGSNRWLMMKVFGVLIVFVSHRFVTVFIPSVPSTCDAYGCSTKRLLYASVARLHL